MDHGGEYLDACLDRLAWQREVISQPFGVIDIVQTTPRQADFQSSSFLAVLQENRKNFHPESESFVIFFRFEVEYDWSNVTRSFE